MKFALIHEGRVLEFAANAEACFPVAPELVWHEVADDTTTRDTFADGAVVKYVAPGPVSVKTLQSGIGVVRFNVVAGVVVTTSDTIGISGITRVSPGRYRCFYENPDTAIALLPNPSIRDAADVRCRVSAQTATYVEVRTVNAAGTPVDVAGIIITFDKVI